MDPATMLRREFLERFGREPRVFFAPGRINLIGAHLDYNGGAVLPVPLRLGTRIAVAPAAGRECRYLSKDLGTERQASPTDRVAAAELGWAAYVHGVFLELERIGVDLPPVDVLVHGDLPRRSGLASSASLAVAAGFALVRLAAADSSMQLVADVAWRAETGYAGVECGIMDQYASALAKAGHALHLDCGRRVWRHVAIDATLELIVLDTCKRRELVDSDFNARVAECREARAILQRVTGRDGDACLADYGRAEIEAHTAALGPVLARRARHVATEVERIAAAVVALEEGDHETLGRLLTASHASCARDYEVSCPELDTLVDRVTAVDGVLGARLTGAGFGGCVVALARPGAFCPSDAAAVSTAYRQCFHTEPVIRRLALGTAPYEIGTD